MTGPDFGELAAHAHGHGPRFLVELALEDGPVGGHDAVEVAGHARTMRVRAARCRRHVADCRVAARTNVCEASRRRGRRPAGWPIRAPFENEKAPTGSIESPNWSRRISSGDRRHGPVCRLVTAMVSMIMASWVCSCGVRTAPNRRRASCGARYGMTSCRRDEVVRDPGKACVFMTEAMTPCGRRSAARRPGVPLTTAGQCWLPSA